ncbi:MAG TPA: 3-methyl-2-oxobutanoate hydroxymethyltransferase [Firmicutes bacterium]|nr:3-methyl-2-oxobutanoate hydroxymethyltransferase [Bacillota bacterium]
MDEKITTRTFRKLKRQGEKISMLTAYDYPTALILDQAGVDSILVGDSAGMVVYGDGNTLGITLENMLYHTRCVTKAVKRSLVIADMPFLTYKITIPNAVKNAGRFIREGRASAVKIEGGEEVCKIVKALVFADIPVMGHIGLTPQAVHKLGGYGVQGRKPESVKYLIRSAKALEKAGAFSIVLENIPGTLAREITSGLEIPTIGIGAGPYCDGQVLVLHDILGFYKDTSPRFAKKYVDLNKIIFNAVKKYSAEIKSGRFPTKKYYIK